MEISLKNWLQAAGIRAAKTFGQALLAVLTLGSNATGVIGVDWKGALSVAALAAVISIANSVIGLPEVDQKTVDQPMNRGDMYGPRM